MKDNQVTTASAEPRIFLLSPALHCVSMTALVFLRSSFGYAFLRPKSIFFALSWAFALFATYAWIDRDAWSEHRALLWFGAAAVILYWFHFAVTIRREWRGVARHDNDAGTPHLTILSRTFRKSVSGRADRRTRLLVEPAIVVGAAVGLYLLAGERHLSAWLIFTASCLWTKELLNQWFSIRRQKRGKDITDDIADAFADDITTQFARNEPPMASSRKHKVRRIRDKTVRDGEDR